MAFHQVALSRNKANTTTVTNHHTTSTNTNNTTAAPLTTTSSTTAIINITISMQEPNPETIQHLAMTANIKQQQGPPTSYQPKHILSQAVGIAAEIAWFPEQHQWPSQNNDIVDCAPTCHLMYNTTCIILCIECYANTSRSIIYL